MKRALAIAMAATFVASISACGEASKYPGAAEPADSPPLEEKPAGTVRPLGAEPEGLVFDQATGILAAGVSQPPSLRLFRESDGRLLRIVPLSSAPRHLSLAGPGGPVLVPAEDSNELIMVRLPGGAKTATPTGEQPHDATFAKGETFVADEFGGSVSVIRGDRVVKTVDTGGQPGGIASEGSRVALVDVRMRVLVIMEAPGGRVLEKIFGGEGPTHAVTDAQGILYVVDTDGNAILRYSLEPEARLLGRDGVGGTPYGVAIDRVHRRLWVTETERNRVVELQVGPEGLSRIATYPTVRQPNSVAVDPLRGVVYISGNAAGVLQRIDVGGKQ